MKILSVLFLLFLTACAHDPLGSIPNEFVRKDIQAGMFQIMTLQKATDPDKPWVVYIAADGYSLIKQITPEPDATPHKAVGWRLAQLDPSPNVAYLARPCQYVEYDPACHEPYWRDRRFAPVVINSMNEALSQIVGNQYVRLVGYSSGGGIAAILASQREDVLNLRTVAGMMDLYNFNRFHQVQHMKKSVDPYEYAYAIRHLPQIHYIGMQDKIVPKELAEFFLYGMGNPDSAMIWPISDATHDSRWEDIWPSLLSCYDGGTGPLSCDVAGLL